MHVRRRVWLVAMIWDGCCGLFAWCQSKLAKLRLRRVRRQEEENTNANANTNTNTSNEDHVFGDIKMILNGEYSLRPWKDNGEISTDSLVESSRDNFEWGLISVSGCSLGCALLPITSSMGRIDEGDRGSDALQCTSFIKLFQPRGGTNVRKICQCPTACPSVWTKRLQFQMEQIPCSVPSYVCGDQTILTQLIGGRALLAIYTYWYHASPSTSRIHVLDLRDGNILLDGGLQLDSGEIYCTSFMENEQDQEINVVVQSGWGDHFRITIYAVPFRSGAQPSYRILSHREVDKNEWPGWRSCLVNQFKSIDNEYFVWFVIQHDNPELSGYVTYERQSDAKWVWSEEPLKTDQWIQTERGNQLWTAAQRLKEIQPNWDLITLLSQVDVKYKAGMIFAKTDFGYLRLYAFRPPSLQSLAADAVREMVYKEVARTKSLSALTWWRKVIVRSGLTQPCSADCAENELEIDDIQSTDPHL